MHSTTCEVLQPLPEGFYGHFCRFPEDASASFLELRREICGTSHRPCPRAISASCWVSGTLEFAHIDNLNERNCSKTGIHGGLLLAVFRSTNSLITPPKAHFKLAEEVMFGKGDTGAVQV